MSFETDAKIVLDALQEFYERSISGIEPVIRQPPMNELVHDMDLEQRIREGGLSGEQLSQFIDTYLSAVTRVYHPANIAHQQAVPHYMAALAGLIDHFISSDGSIYELGPALVSIEYYLINWLLQKVGWEPAVNHRVILVHRCSPIRDHRCSPKLVHWCSPKLVQ